MTCTTVGSRWLRLLAWCVLPAVAAGCNSEQAVGDAMFPNDQGQMKSLGELKDTIVLDSLAVQTVAAKCRAVLMGPALRDQYEPDKPLQLELTGEIALEKPGKVYLRLERPGKIHVRLVGDGEHYVVQAFEDSYSGQYGDPVEKGVKRIHILPEDLADAFDLGGLFADRSQVLRAYPFRGDLLAGTPENPVMYPPSWSIDSIEVTESPRPAAWVHDSILIDRQTEQVRCLDKFRPDGTLKVRVWYLETSAVRDAAGRVVRVPSALMLWYPPPLEGTVLYLRLEESRVNTPIPAAAFSLN